MKRIHVSLKTLVNFAVAFIVLDLLFFGIGMIPDMRLSFGEGFFTPTSWSFDYYISDRDSSLVGRDIAIIALVFTAICIYGWAMSLIEENV